MTALTNIVFGVGLAFVIVAALVVGTLIVVVHTRPHGVHHASDDATWPPELPERHEAPPHPDGRTA